MDLKIQIGELEIRKSESDEKMKELAETIARHKDNIKKVNKAIEYINDASYDAGAIDNFDVMADTLKAMIVFSTMAISCIQSEIEALKNSAKKYNKAIDTLKMLAA